MDGQNKTIKKDAPLKTKRGKKLVLDALAKNLGIVTTACKSSGVSRARFYVWYNEDESFRKSVDDVENIALDFVESQHYKQIQNGNASNIIFHLKTRGKDRGYIERKEIEHSGGVNLNLTELTEEELEKIRDE